jgi:hypothetical protein
VFTPLAGRANELKLGGEPLHEATRFIARCDEISANVSISAGIVMALKKLEKKRPSTTKK